MSTSFFSPVSPQVHFPGIEQDVLSFWKGSRVFEQSLQQRSGGPLFTFYDGPPFATGLPHYGHLVGGTLKDIVPRYWSMCGYNVSRRFGWDCHGLPIESLVQQKLGLSSVKDIRSYGIHRFNEACRENVLMFTREWRRTVERMGRWVDFDNDYKTMDPSFMESVWWVFGQCFDKGLVYQDYRIQPYSPSLATPLSNFEVNQGYRDRQDPALTLTMPLEGDDAAMLVWTTTPWTLPSNLAIAVHPDLVYVKASPRGESKRYWVAESRLGAVLGEDAVVVEKARGRELEGRTYQPLFTFAPRLSDRQYTLLCASFVSDTEGTGAVHVAPSFGEDDFVLGRQVGLGLFDPLDAEGRFNAAVPLWEGVGAKEADKEIGAHLKRVGRVFRHETIVHSYPHCWRTDVPLLYRALKTWFLRVDAPLTGGDGRTRTLKEWMIEANAAVNWVPEHIREGRFGKWLEGARDWNVGRNRFWGTPIPVWIAQDDPSDMICVSSIAQLEALTGTTITDLHLHVVDRLEVRTSDKVTRDPRGRRYVRTSEVLDCWFESGSMPCAQIHYPFENREDFAQRYPADFIAEGIDQTRGWFYTLTVLGCALFQKQPFRNVIVNGTILAEDGQKMSKRLRNYTPPDEMMERLGADAMRLFLMNSPAVAAEDLRFSDAGVTEMARAVLLPFWNAYSFFVTYATVDGFTPDQCREAGTSSCELDRWIVSLLNDTIRRIATEMERYNLFRVVPLLVDFIDNLTNWYIRRSRRRFWRSENDTDKRDAYSTLYSVLVDFSRVMAPFLPFLTESVYRNLRGAPRSGETISVHLCSYPSPRDELIDNDLDRKMALARQVVTMGRALRSRFVIKNRQPLQQCTIVVADAHSRGLLGDMEQLIAEELNVKGVVFSQDESLVVTLCAKPNFKRLGKVYGARMKEVAGTIAQLDAQAVARIRDGGTIELLGHTLGVDDIAIQRVCREGVEVETAQALTVALDTTITEELLQEGMAREFVNRVQNLRKERGFSVSDRIMIVGHANPGLAEALEVHAAYICAETLARSLDVRSSKTETMVETAINGHKAFVDVVRVPDEA